MTRGSDSAPQWDFFVSYTQSDRAWAEWIAWLLEEDRHRVLIQAWDFVPGSNWVNRMQDGVRAASRTIAVLSGQYLDSVYGAAEWQAAWAADPAGRDRKLLVVRIADGERPGLLSGVVGVDVFGVSEAMARTRVREMVARAAAGRSKPGTPPPFPPAMRAVPSEPRFPGALPGIWSMPARNPNFTGRVKDLAALTSSLTSGVTVTVQSVHGMGGVGKTQLAVEYAHVHATDYDLVWWIPAEQPALIPDQFAGLARQLGLDSDAVVDPDGVRKFVHDALRQLPGWLLVFDNADAVRDVRPWVPSAPLLPGIRAHVIVTTRRGGFSRIGRVLDLDVLDMHDATAFLRVRLPGMDTSVCQRLAAELGRLPLALEQAAAYLDHTQMPPAEYLDLLVSRGHELHARGHAADHTDTVATLWTLSLEKIAHEEPASVRLLDLCGYLAPEPIPLDLFTAHHDLLGLAVNLFRWCRVCRVRGWGGGCSSTRRGRCGGGSSDSRGLSSACRRF